MDSAGIPPSVRRGRSAGRRDAVSAGDAVQAAGTRRAGPGRGRTVFAVRAAAKEILELDVWRGRPRPASRSGSRRPARRAPRPDRRSPRAGRRGRGRPGTGRAAPRRQWFGSIARQDGHGPGRGIAHRSRVSASDWLAPVSRPDAPPLRTPKRAERAGGRHPRGRPTRSTSAQADRRGAASRKALELLARAFGDAADRAIRLVGDPAVEPEGASPRDARNSGTRRPAPGR